MIPCCLSGDLRGVVDLVSVPTICAMHKAVRAAADADARAEHAAAIERETAADRALFEFDDRPRRRCA